MALPRYDRPPDDGPGTTAGVNWAARQRWVCQHCGCSFAPASERIAIVEVWTLAFYPARRFALVWQTRADQRPHPDRWEARCPRCGEPVALPNPLNPLLLGYAGARRTIGYAMLAGALLNMVAFCAYPGLVPFVFLAVAVVCCVVAATVPEAPWWRHKGA